VEPGALKRPGTNESAFSLGVVRAIVHGSFLIGFLFTSFAALGELPPTILRPAGFMKFVPWSFYELLLTPASMGFLKWITVLSLLLSTSGYLTPLTTKTSLVLVVFFEGLVRSFGHFNHDEMIAVYFMFVLAFTPCGDAFSLDSWAERKDSRPELAYRYPVFLMQLLMAWAYFSSALIKLRVAGFKYFSADNLPSLAIYHSLDNLHDTHFKVAFWLPQYRCVTPLIVTAVILWELIFPLSLISRRLRWWLLGIGVVFHVATLFLMNIFFPYFLIMYLVFVDWPAVAKRIREIRRPDRGHLAVC
jgi:hypothetical protein